MGTPDTNPRAAVVAKEEYQYGFSAMHADVMYDDRSRRIKAEKTMAVIRDYLAGIGQRPEDQRLLDIGCSTGFLSSYYAQSFRHVTGIDIDMDAVLYAQKHNTSRRTTFLPMDSLNIAVPDNSFEAVTCTHIYEHVPDAARLLEEIHRGLKPGGFCYFAAGNRLMWMEPHYQLPLLSILPRRLADRYVRWSGRADFYYEKLLWHGQIRRLVRRFEIIDYTDKVIQHPDKYHLTDVLTPESTKHRLARLLVRTCRWAVPTYIWILRKPAEPGGGPVRAV